MQEKRKALGKGLEQLFSNESFDLDDFEKNVLSSTSKKDIKDINIDELRSNPYQPRLVFDEEKLEELSDSIKEYGIIQPIIVKRSIKGYEIIAGERRVIAAKKAGLKSVPAIVRDLTDEEMLELSTLENIQRENLNVIEEAYAYKKMLDMLELTQEQLSKKIGKSRSHITNILGLLNLPKRTQDLVLENKLSMGHARTLSKLSNEEEIYKLSDKIIRENLSVRDLENFVGNSPKKNQIKTYPKINKYINLQSVLRKKIGSMVKVNNKNIVIPFENDKDLERILEILNIKVELDDDDI